MSTPAPPALAALALLALTGCDQASTKPAQETIPAPAAESAALPPTPPGRHALAPRDARFASENRLLPPGTQSLLPVKDPLAHGAFVWNDTDVPPGPLTVWVDLRRQLVSVFRGGHEIGTAVVLYGGQDKETPTGRFPILSKHADYHSRTYDAPMPHALFLTADGVALHGSEVENGRATHGCVGLPPEFARLLYEEADRGDLVEIVRSDASPSQPVLANR